MLVRLRAHAVHLLLSSVIRMDCLCAFVAFRHVHNEALVALMLSIIVMFFLLEFVEHKSVETYIAVINRGIRSYVYITVLRGYYTEL